MKNDGKKNGVSVATRSEMGREMSEAMLPAGALPATVDRQTGEITPAPAPVLPQRTAADLVERVALIQSAMKQAMRAEVDFGHIPGCGKPCLFQPGAEKLCVLLQLSPTYEVERSWEPGTEKTWTKRRKNGEAYASGTTVGALRYQVACTLAHIPTGQIVGQGLGVCNNFEAKWISQDPYTVEETILQMARKRALVNAARTVSGASDVFTQDENIIRASMPARDNGKAPPATATAQQPGAPRCPKCGGAMWDNREERREDQAAIAAKTRTKKARPAWKCKAENCDGLQWDSGDEKAEGDAETPDAAETMGQMRRMITAQFERAGITAKDDQVAWVERFFEVKNGRLTQEQLQRVLAAQAAELGTDESQIADAEPVGELALPSDEEIAQRFGKNTDADLPAEDDLPF